MSHLTLLESLRAENMSIVAVSLSEPSLTFFRPTQLQLEQNNSEIQHSIGPFYKKGKFLNACDNIKFY